MSVHQTRMRALTREQQMGGGLTGQSLTDTATDQDVLQSYTGDGTDGPDAIGAVDIDWDEVYGGQATRADSPTPDPYTAEEALHDQSKYASRMKPRAQASYDVAEITRFATITIPVGSDPFLLSGRNQNRKRIVIKNASFPNAVLACDVNVGNDASVPRVVGGSGALLLRGGNSALGYFGDQIELETMEEIWVVQAVDAVVPPQPITLTWAQELYAE